MNKILIFLLGILLLPAGKISSMDTATFNSLIELYNNEELTRQQLLDAYDQLNSEDAQDEARRLLEDLGTPIDEIKAAALEEQELYTITFDTLIRMYKEQEITRAQLIKAYNLFETAEDKDLGDQALQVLLNKSVETLRHEESSQAPQYGHGRPQRVQPQRPAPQRAHQRGRGMRCRQGRAQNQRPQVAQRAHAPVSRAIPGRRGNIRHQEPARNHVSVVQERKRRRNAYSHISAEQLQAQEDLNRALRESSQEHQDLQEAISRSQIEQYRPAHVPVRNQQENNGERQARLNRLLDQNLAQQVEQQRAQHELGLEVQEPIILPVEAPRLEPQGQGNPLRLAPAPEHPAAQSPQPVRAVPAPAVPAQAVGQNAQQSYNDFMRQVHEQRLELESRERDMKLQEMANDEQPVPQPRAPHKESQKRKEPAKKPAPPKPLQRSQKAENASPEVPQQRTQAVNASRESFEQKLSRRVAALEQEVQGDQKAAPAALTSSQTSTQKTAAVAKKEPKIAQPEAPKKTVRFDLPQEISESILQAPAAEMLVADRVELQAPMKAEEARVAPLEKVSVQLGAGTGTPVFQRGSAMLNPKIAEAFNKKLSETSTEIVTQWSTQLAQLASSDTERVKLLKPIFEAFNKPHAPLEKLELLVKETFERLDEAKQTELTSLVATIF